MGVASHGVHLFQGGYERSSFLGVGGIAREMVISPYFSLAMCIDVLKLVTNATRANLELGLQKDTIVAFLQFKWWLVAFTALEVVKEAISIPIRALLGGRGDPASYKLVCTHQGLSTVLLST